MYPHHTKDAMLLLGLLAFALALSVRGAASPPLYKNPKASIEARVADLLPRMTVQEKVAQM